MMLLLGKSKSYSLTEPLFTSPDHSFPDVVGKNQLRRFLRVPHRQRQQQERHSGSSSSISNQAITRLQAREVTSGEDRALSSTLPPPPPSPPSLPART